MNAVTSIELGHLTAKDIQVRLGYRAARLLKLRCDLKAIASENGPLTAKELFDFVCCLHAVAGKDLVEAKASLLDLSCDLDGIVAYGVDE